LIATLIVLVFALFGQPILNQLGVSLPALQVAGGIILLMIALEMTLAKRPGTIKLSAKESEEAESKAEAHAEITVFPLATPLLAGPGAMTSAIVLAAGTQGQFRAARFRGRRDYRGDDRDARVPAACAGDP
jgi:multiple antibiotic resistance protein